MDRYGARGELLADTGGQSVLGPFLADKGTDRAYEFNADGTTTVWARGQGSWIEQDDKDRHKLTRNEYMEIIADRFYDGCYHDWACFESYFDGLIVMRSASCKGTLPTEWEAWIKWASAVLRGVAIDEQTRGRR